LKTENETNANKTEKQNIGATEKHAAATAAAAATQT
jgi:hypothetical protein